MKRKTSYAVACLIVAGVIGCEGDPESETAALPTPELGETIELGGTLGAIAVHNGEAWIIDESAGTVIRLDSEGEPIGRPIEVEGGPTSIATGEELVWVASGTGAITRIDSATGEATAIAKASLQPGGIAADDDSVWVTNPVEDKVERFDASSGEALGDYSVGNLPTDIAILDGSAWVANTDDGTVSRIEVESGDVSEPLEVASQQVLALSADEESLWVAGTSDERVEAVEVSRIDTSDGEVAETSAPLDSGIPVRLATGDGGVWAMLAGPALEGEGSVALIDPATGEASGDALAVGSQPRGIATGDGSVWVTDAEGTVTRIDASG